VVRGFNLGKKLLEGTKKDSLKKRQKEGFNRAPSQLAAKGEEKQRAFPSLTSRKEDWHFLRKKGRDYGNLERRRSDRSFAFGPGCGKGKKRIVWTVSREEGT